MYISKTGFKFCMLFQKQIFEHQMFRLNCESLFFLNYKLCASIAWNRTAISWSLRKQVVILLDSSSIYSVCEGFSCVRRTNMEIKNEKF